MPRIERQPAAPPAIQSVGFLLVPGFALMTYASAIEPLRAANQLSGRPLYRWWHAAAGNKPALASNGAAILPDFPFGTLAGAPDLVLVCAGGNPAKYRDKPTFAWLRKLARQGTIVGGISGGPFILARAGLLEGRRCTLHWEHLPAFQELFPRIKPTRSLFEIDKDRITCAGGVAGLDLMVALISRDHGMQLGAAVSDWFLHTHVREGARPQRMDLRFRLGIANDKLLKALAAMEAQIEKPLSRRRIAQIAGTSLRQLERSFSNELGSGIHQRYLMLRLDRAHRLIHETALSMIEVATATGFESASQFSRAFRRQFGFAPRDLRRGRGAGEPTRISPR
jgi:transcriptional regulator GlxA family with amidase domain